MYSYFQESDTVAMLLNEKDELNKQLSDAEAVLSKQQAELNIIINGSGPSGALKFTDLQKEFNDLMMPAPDANGAYSTAQQAQIKRNAEVEKAYLYARDAQPVLNSNISNANNFIKDVKDKIKKINDQIEKKTTQATIEAKEASDKKNKKIMLFSALVIVAVIAIKYKS